MSSLQKSPRGARDTQDVGSRISIISLDAVATQQDSAGGLRPGPAERRTGARHGAIPHADVTASSRKRVSRSTTQTLPRRNVGKRTSEAPSLSPTWSAAKRGIDFVGSLVLLGLLSPVFAALYILVARSGGKVFYGHRRIGRNGEWFTCYKFRTMIPDAENVLKRVLAENPELQAEWDRDEKLRNDPRVTRVGEFLRRTSLDELPQLYNVLRGDMSLVGPRPATDVGKEHYGRAWRWYLAVRPGMTGLWQVSGRNDVGFRRRIVLDVYYIRNQTLWLDLQILFRTIRVVFGSTGY